MKKLVDILDAIAYNFIITACILTMFIFLIGIIGSILPFWISLIISCLLVGLFISVFPHMSIIDAWFGVESDD